MVLALIMGAICSLRASLLALGVWPLLLGVGAMAAGTNVLTTLALWRAGALETLSATLCGRLIFSEILDLLTGIPSSTVRSVTSCFSYPRLSKNVTT